MAHRKNDILQGTLVLLILRTLSDGQMALCCVSERARELLRMTSLDLVWPIYATRREAFEALLAD